MGDVERLFGMAVREGERFLGYAAAAREQHGEEQPLRRAEDALGRGLAFMRAAFDESMAPRERRH